METEHKNAAVTRQKNPRTNWIQRLGWQKLLFESFLIVLSILFALLINEWRKGQEQAAQRDKALNMVLQELKHNYEELEIVMPYHQKVNAGLDSILTNSTGEALSDSPLKQILSSVARRGIMPPELQTTAWNTSQLSGAMSLFDEETIYALANVYELQANGVGLTWKEIANFYLSPSLFDMEKNQIHLSLLAVYFYELYQQERFLMDRTGEAIKTLEGKVK